MTISDKDKRLTRKCSNFIDLTAQVNLLTRSAVQCYLNKQRFAFEEYVEQVRQLESNGDVLRRDTESHLYTEALIPESRGDLLGLIESTDDIIDQIKKTILLFAVEEPEIPPSFHADYQQLIEICVAAVDEVLLAFRLFFTEPNRIGEVITKTYAWEKAADKQAAKIIHNAFRTTNLSLSQQMHLRYFAHNIDLIADKAEDLADRLSLAAIKQMQ